MISITENDIKEIVKFIKIAENENKLQARMKNNLYHRLQSSYYDGHADGIRMVRMLLESKFLSSGPRPGPSCLPDRKTITAL
jgi:hypothetical protein